MRLGSLGAGLDHVLETAANPLVISIHVQTGSSVSAQSVHPEMWAPLRHLGHYTQRRFDEVEAHKAGDEDLLSAPLVLAFAHRRILDSGGRRQNEAYAEVIASAGRCEGLLELDPLDPERRADYLCRALGVGGVPPEVSR